MSEHFILNPKLPSCDWESRETVHSGHSSLLTALCGKIITAHPPLDNPCPMLHRRWEGASAMGGLWKIWRKRLSGWGQWGGGRALSQTLPRHQVGREAFPCAVSCFSDKNESLGGQLHSTFHLLGGGCILFVELFDAENVGSTGKFSTYPHLSQ